MSDVEVSLGGDISPFMVQMARAKELAAKGGEAAGFEFGNRTAYMAEQRIKRGMDGILKNLATAKDPIDAITGSVEGLAQSFRVAGAALLGVGIGTFLKEQLEKAAEGAQDFYKKTDDIFAVANNSSKEFTEKAIKNFEDAKEAYGKEGFFEWLIYGAGQKETLKNGEEAYEQALARARAMRESEYKADADAASTNAEERAQGEIAKVNERYDAEVEKAKNAGDSIIDIERSRAEAISEIRDKLAKEIQEKANKPDLMDTFDDLAAKVKLEQSSRGEDKNAKKEQELQQRLLEARNKYGDLNTAGRDPIAIERAKYEYEKAISDLYDHRQEVAISTAEKEAEASRRAAESVKKGIELQEEIDEEGMTDAQKANALKVKIAKQEKDLKNFVGPLSPEMVQNKKNEILENKLELTRLTDPKRVSQDKTRHDALAEQQKSAQKRLISAQVEATAFHAGPVSSLRRVGFGRAPAENHNQSQLKAVQESKVTLDKILKEMAALNNKIGGVA